MVTPPSGLRVIGPEACSPNALQLFKGVPAPWLQAVENSLNHIFSNSIKQRVHPENSLLNQNHSAE